MLTFLGVLGEVDGEDDGEVWISNFFRMGGDDVQKSGTNFRAQADVSAALLPLPITQYIPGRPIHN